MDKHSSRDPQRLRNERRTNKPSAATTYRYHGTGLQEKDKQASQHVRARTLPQHAYTHHDHFSRQHSQFTGVAGLEPKQDPTAARLGTGELLGGLHDDCCRCRTSCSGAAAATRGATAARCCRRRRRRRRRRRPAADIGREPTTVPLATAVGAASSSPARAPRRWSGFVQAGRLLPRSFQRRGRG